MASACSRGSEPAVVDAAAPVDASNAEASSAPLDAATQDDASTSAVDAASDVVSDALEAGKKKVTGGNTGTRGHGKTGGVPPPSYDDRF